MNKIINCKILPNIKTVVEYYSGDIFIDDIIEFKKEISQHHDYKPNFNLIMDFRDSDLKIDESGVKKYVEFANTYTKIKAERNTAFLADKPNEVVLTTLFGMLKKDLPITPAIFTTLEAAVNWISYSLDNYYLIESTINNFKNTP